MCRPFSWPATALPSLPAASSRATEPACSSIASGEGLYAACAVGVQVQTCSIP